MKIVFLGSPDFALPSLSALLTTHEVCGVITPIDRPSGRGQKPKSVAVAQYCKENAMDLLQTDDVNNKKTLAWLKEKKPDILVVVAFGKFLKKDLLAFCDHPPVNLHPSKLPQLRGAAPIQWAIINGLKTTGLSTQFMVLEMDAGDILLQESMSILPNETAGELQDRLKELGSALLVETINKIEEKKIVPKAQRKVDVSFAPPLKKIDGILDWRQKKLIIHNRIRGLNPWPMASSTFRKESIKILRSCVPKSQDCPPSLPSTPGAFRFYGERLFVQAQDGALEILGLQLAGKRAILPMDFANGMRGLKLDEAKYYFGE